MANITSDVDAKVASNRSGSGVERVRRAKHFAPCLHHALSFPNHRAHGSGAHELHKPIEEAFASQVGVMLFKMRCSRLTELHGLKAKPLTLKTGDDLSDKSALHAVRLDHNE